MCSCSCAYADVPQERAAAAWDDARRIRDVSATEAAASSASVADLAARARAHSSFLKLNGPAMAALSLAESARVVFFENAE